MTLLDLCRLIRRHWKLVVVLSVVCVLVCAVALFVRDEQSKSGQTATARIVANTNIAVVYGHAASGARVASNADSHYETVAKVDTNSMTVTVTVTGPDGEECLQLANAVAADAVRATELDFAENEGSDFKTAFRAQIEPAELSATGTSGKLRYLIVALLGGLFVAVCIVVIIDLVKRPVRSAEHVQDAVKLPVLEILPVADNGERLLANIRFAAGVDALSNVLIVPAGDRSVAEESADLLKQATEIEGMAGFTASSCPPLSQGMAGAYEAQNASAVLVATRQWTDSMKQLEPTVAELELAGVRLAGVIFAKEGKRLH